MQHKQNVEGGGGGAGWQLATTTRMARAGSVKTCKFCANFSKNLAISCFNVRCAYSQPVPHVQGLLLLHTHTHTHASSCAYVSWSGEHGDGTRLSSHSCGLCSFCSWLANRGRGRGRSQCAVSSNGHICCQQNFKSGSPIVYDIRKKSKIKLQKAKCKQTVVVCDHSLYFSLTGHTMDFGLPIACKSKSYRRLYYLN